MNSQPPLKELLQQLLNANNWEFAKHLVTTHPVLFTDEALELLDKLIEHYRDNDSVLPTLLAYQQILNRCHTDKIEVAFDDYIVKEELVRILKILDTPIEPTQLDKRIALCQRGLSLIDKTTQSDIWTLLHTLFAENLMQDHLETRSTSLEQAIEHYKLALEVRMPNKNPIDWARTLSQLASAYFKRLQGERSDNLEKAITAYEQVLTVFKYDTHPFQWAATMQNLGNAYSERIQGEHAKNIEQAIEYFQQSLIVFTREDDPAHWATVINNLAKTYHQRIHGEPKENIEQARVYSHQALEVINRDEMPQEWAETLHNLAAVYIDRIEGEPTENLEQAISYYQQVLEVKNRTETPLEWADTLMNLAMAYYHRLQDNRTENLEKAVQLYHQAEEISRQDTMPVQWGDLMNNLGLVYRVREKGILAENIEQAIIYYQKSLTVRTYENMPVEWATTTTNLGVAYVHRLWGNKADNLEKAIDCYQAALKIRTHEALPWEWAATLMNLGIAYSDRILGNQADNLEQAIACFQQVLTLVTQENLPSDWADTLNNLASVYQDRMVEDRAENLEQAIAYYNLTLNVHTRQSHPIDWARTINNLASVYHNRIQGDRAENFERALDYCQQALEIRTRQTDALAWAETTSNLAIIYSERLRGDLPQNVEQSVNYYEQALQVMTQQNMPVQWATVMDGIATTYLERRLGNHTDNIEQAIKYYQQALTVRTRERNPLEWAKTLGNLSSAYYSRGQTSDNLTQSLTYSRQALEVLTRQSQPILWANMMTNVGNAYSEQTQGNRADNIKQALDAYQQALEVETLEALPNEHRKIQYNLGNLYFDERNWEQAYTAYAAALQASELLYQAGATSDSRQAELRENRDLSTQAAYCLGKLGRFVEAINSLEQGKARLLSETLALKEAVFKDISEPDQLAFHSIHQRLAALEVETRNVGQPGVRNFLAISEDLHNARTELSNLVTRIRAGVPEFLSMGLDFDGVSAISHALNQPLVYLLTTLQGSVAFIVPPIYTNITEQYVIWLPQFNTSDLNDILYGQNGQSSYLQGTVQADTPVLKSALDELWPILPDTLIEPIIQSLMTMQYQQAVLILSGNLNLLPLHAVSNQAIQLTVSPSARALQTVFNNMVPQRRMLPLHFLGIGNPKNNEAPLLFARFEVENIAPLFSSYKALYEKQATRVLTLKALPETSYLHFSCHGRFNLNNPLESKLYLAGRDVLTLREILNEVLALSNIRLVVLSACQTGIIDFQNVPDETIGFPTGFLQAGVPGVISTLWPVAEISTALLLMRFYRYHLENGWMPAKALHAAQHWLREGTVDELGLVTLFQKIYLESKKKDVNAFQAMRNYKSCLQEKPFAHPYYWAGFVFSGV